MLLILSIFLSLNFAILTTHAFKLKETEIITYKVLYAINMTILEQNRSASGIATVILNVKVKPVNATHMLVTETSKLDVPPLYSGDVTLGNLIVTQLSGLVGVNNSVQKSIKKIYDGTIFYDVRLIDKNLCRKFSLPEINISLNTINITININNTLANALYDCETGLLVAYYFHYAYSGVYHGRASNLTYVASIHSLKWLINTTIDEISKVIEAKNETTNLNEVYKPILMLVSLITVVALVSLFTYRYLKKVLLR